MRGYSYQVLRSIEAWIDLDNGEMLVLEGAEDLDLLGDGGAAAVEQVKDTAGSGNVTLRSQSVLEAIGNFWDHQERNPSVPIRFRFLTTSGVGREKSRPFGFDDPGLEAWRRIQAAPTAVDSMRMASGIQTFLKNQEILPGTMRDWLTNANTQNFIDRIVVPMEWVTGWPNWRDLYDTLLAKLVELGDCRGIGSADAVAALDALHTEAWRIATTKGSRSLRRGDLLRIIDQACTTAVPNQQLRAILGLITGAATGSTTVSVAPEAFGMAPRPSPRHHPRPILEGRIRDALSSGTVLIYGATGMGKTGLAIVVTGDTRPAAWVDMRDLPVGVAAARIDSLVGRLPQLGQVHDVVLDDLPAGGDARVLEAPLGRLRSVQDGLGGALLVTYADRLPTRIATQLSLDGSRAFSAPAFDEKDIVRYLVASGCPIETADTWSKIIHVSTSGHPQFVDARIAALTEAGFPAPDITELLVPRPEILDVRAEARRLVASLPGDDRELLARTSLLLGRARRTRLMAIAQVNPPIAEPGDVIDRLTGPWLERMDNDDLRPSPLLRNLGSDTRGQGWATAIHRGIAFSFMRQGELLASDVFQIATHAMLGKTAAPLIALIPSLLQASSEVWAQVAETSSMLTYIGVDEDLSLPFPDPNDTAAFRVLQLRIAIEAGNEKQVAKLVDRSIVEFDAVDNSRVPGPDLFELVFLWQLLQRPGNLPLGDRLRLSIRFVNVGARIAETFRSARRPEGVDDADLEWPDLVPFVPMTLIPVVSDVEGLTELLDLVDMLDPSERALALGGYAGESETAAVALDRVWLGEASRSEPRWPEFATALQRALSMSGELRVATLEAAAAPLLVRVLDENVRDHDGALAIADELIAKTGRSPRVLAAKARVLWRRNCTAEALELYEEALPAFPLGMSWRTDVLRDAAMAAGKGDDWPLATRRLTAALASLSEEEPLVRRVGILFDLAIATYLSGQIRDAVNLLGEAIKLLAEDGQDMPAEPLLSVRQIGSQAIKTIGAELGTKSVRDRENMPLARLFGLTSGLEELTWGEQKPARLDLVALLMAELDLQMVEYPVIAVRLAQRLRASPDLLVQSAQGDMQTRLAVRTLDITASAADALREVRAFRFAAAEREAGRELVGRRFEDIPETTKPLWQELVKYRLLACIVAMVAQGKIAEIPIEAWEKELPKDGSMVEIVAMLNDLGQLMAGTEDASRRIMGGNATWDQHLLAALMAPVQQHLSPDQLLICHVVAAHYLHQAKLAEFTDEPFSELVTTAWLDRCDRPFQLVTPRLTVPAIRRAATTSAAGWPRVLAVLEAARNAVSASAASSVSEFLKAFRKKVAPLPAQ